MEELRSTEILDKEIHEDARKKAERILANANSECEKIRDNVAVRIATVRKEKEAFYAERLAVKTKDSEAAVPLEKERFLVSFEGNAMMNAINSYLQGLSEEQQLRLVENLLVRYGNAVSGKRISACVFGLDIGAVEKLLRKIFGSQNVLSCVSVAFEDTGLEEPAGLSVHKGIILDSEDGLVRCRATFGEVVAELLDDHSLELAQTLFCGRLPQ